MTLTDADRHARRTNAFVPWPPQLVDEYRRRGYWTDERIGDLLVERARSFGERVAVVDGERRMTYAELATLADRLAGHLVDRGLAGGARIVFQLPNVAEWIVAYVACLRVGAVPICAIPSHRHNEIGAFAQLAKAAAWFGPSEMRGFDYLAMIADVQPIAPTLREIWVLGRRRPPATASFDELLRAPPRATADEVARFRPEATDPAVLQLSGGTTGTPKLVPRTHNDYLFTARAAGARKSIDADTVHLVPLPIAHNFSLASGVQSALLVGARNVLAASPSPDTVLPLIERERVTWLPTVPATLGRWIDAVRARRRDLSSIRVLFSAGQHLSPDLARSAIETFGPVLRQGYGMAEGLSCFTLAEDAVDVHVHSQGRPMCESDELRVVDDEGRVLPAGEIGELQCRGPTTIRGYYAAPEHNAIAFTPDGFYCTGDLVRIRTDGRIVVEGRKKDVINRGGEKISAEELETVIARHPAVKETAVIPYACSVLGERVCACVVLQPGASLTLRALVEFLQTQRLATFKIPERLEVVERMPLTPVGKTAKHALRARFRS